MNDNKPKPTKKYHSKDKSTSDNNLSATIAKLEAYSKQSKMEIDKETLSPK